MKYKHLKRLYFDFNDSVEGDLLGEMPEVKKANADIDIFTKRLSKADSFEMDDLTGLLGAANEMQGFVYGFRYCVQLMMECMPEGGGSNDQT